MLGPVCAAFNRVSAPQDAPQLRKAGGSFTQLPNTHAGPIHLAMQCMAQRAVLAKTLLPANMLHETLWIADMSSCRCEIGLSSIAETLCIVHRQEGTLHGPGLSQQT